MNPVPSTIIRGNNSSNPDGPFAAISKALQSGDIQAAQQAAQAMQGHHHHHAHATSGTTAAPANSNAAAALGVGQNVNLSA